MGQRCALLWPFMRSHQGLSTTRRCCPNGVSLVNLADTINATYDGGIDVPHECLSGAKISIIPETSKQFPKFNIKQREASIKSRLSYVLSYYNKYVQSVITPLPVMPTCNCNGYVSAKIVAILLSQASLA